LWRLLAAMTFRKVMRTVKHHQRQRRDVQLDQRSESGEPVHIPDLSPGPEQVNILIDYLNWIFNRLPDSSQSVVKLRLDGYSIAEIAMEVKVSQRTVKRTLAHVRELISMKLDEEKSD
jgi:RNA polymerase sigma factor (sigma-70 family)